MASRSRVRVSSPRLWQKLTVWHVKDYTPTRLALSFVHPNTDYSDQFYVEKFYRLHMMVLKLLETHMRRSSTGTGTGPTWYWKGSASPWAVDYHRQFVRYAEYIARPGNPPDSWDELLREETDRNLLVSGIILKLLEDNVFAPLLFGADSQQQEMLETQDRTLLNHDGFARSSLRSATVRTYLTGQGGIPPSFWPTVDALAVKIMVLLLPYINTFGEAYTDSWQGIHAIYQDVHEIVQFAGWLAVCVRWSPTVFRYEYARPGSSANLEQVVLDDESFERSRRAVAKLDAELAKRLPASELLTHVTRVKISVVPEIKRCRPEMDQGGEVLGQRVYSVARAHVVYYWGLLEDADDDRLLVPLRQWIYQKKTVYEFHLQRMNQLRVPLLALSVVLLSFLVVLGYPKLCQSDDQSLCRVFGPEFRLTRFFLHKISQALQHVVSVGEELKILT